MNEMYDSFLLDFRLNFQYLHIAQFSSSLHIPPS